MTEAIHIENVSENVMLQPLFHFWGFAIQMRLMPRHKVLLFCFHTTILSFLSISFSLNHLVFLSIHKQLTSSDVSLISTQRKNKQYEEHMINLLLFGRMFTNEKSLHQCKQANKSNLMALKTFTAYHWMVAFVRSFAHTKLPLTLNYIFNKVFQLVSFDRVTIFKRRRIWPLISNRI